MQRRDHNDPALHDDVLDSGSVLGELGLVAAEACFADPAGERTEAAGAQQRSAQLANGLANVLVAGVAPWPAAHPSCSPSRAQS